MNRGERLRLRKIFRFLLLCERYYRTIVGLFDEFPDFIGFQNFCKCLEAFIIFVAFFYYKYVYIGLCCFGIGFLICNGILSYGEACFKSIVSV